MYEAKKVTKEAMESALNTFMPLYEKADQQMLVADSMVDTSLAAMQFMLIAREHGYDTNAMAGYDASKAALTMGLDTKQYINVIAIEIGKHDPNAEEEINTSIHPIIEIVVF